MITRLLRPLPHGITLECRVAGAPGRPLLVFLHGFPEGAFVWDPLLEHFADPRHGGYRCVAPNLRGYGASSSPPEVAAYRARHLVQDIVALIADQGQGRPAACLVAHDWGGAVAWNLAALPAPPIQRLAILNSPHPATFLRELRGNPQQQAASAYMNFLVRPDAEALLGEDDHRRMWALFEADGGAPWMTPQVRDIYRALWRGGPGLVGGCNYYRASPLRPPTPQDRAAADITLPDEAVTVRAPTLVLWGMKDRALLPVLLDGLDRWVPRMTLQRLEDASHWLVHEQPQVVVQQLANFLGAVSTDPARQAAGS